jgi:formylglycine-generating enzyme required for sulfatase activity
MPDEPDKAAPAADSVPGKEAGEVRDDNELKMKLVWCPPGAFTMGSPRSEARRKFDEEQVDVTLSSGFWLGKFEVTQSEWKQVMETQPWKGKPFTSQGDDVPATYVNWDDAMEFCRRLTERERNAGRVPAGWEYTLPTEAQWEHACRAQAATRFNFGDTESDLGEYAWYHENAWNSREQFAHRVGQKKPNAWGLYDMHGNVVEWCRDLYSKELPGGDDPEVTDAGSGRIGRGGSWFHSAFLCRSASRDKSAPTVRSRGLGFRVAWSPIVEE